MSNNQQLFAEIIPSEEANLSGGCGGYQNRSLGPAIEQQSMLRQ